MKRSRLPERFDSPAAQLERVKRLLHGAVHFEAFYLQVYKEKHQPKTEKKGILIEIAIPVSR